MKYLRALENYGGIFVSVYANQTSFTEALFFLLICLVNHTYLPPKWFSDLESPGRPVRQTAEPHPRVLESVSLCWG